MLNLNSDQWGELEHAYGTAEDIPGLLEQLSQLPEDDGKSAPWFPLWSALAHQGDVFSASFAAVPHIIDALSKAPEKAHESYFHFPAWVEICRAKQMTEVPSELQEAYFEALNEIPRLAAAAATKSCESGFLACVLAAIAAAKGQHAMAEAILELGEEGTVEDFLEWQSER